MRATGRITSSRLRTLYLFGTAAWMVLPSTAALAQKSNAVSAQSTGAQSTGAGSTGAGLETITVTTRKRSEKLQKVPVAVRAIGAKELRQQGVRTLADIANLTPGLTYDQGISTVDSRPALRGLYAERGRPSVAVLIDGYDTTSEGIVSAGGGVLVNLNLLDLDRVEVVKGPQSALYGRSAFGGAINYITAPATSKPSGSINVEIGDYGDYKTAGTFSQAINDKVKFRVSLEGDGSNGFYRNTVNNERLGGHQTQGGSLEVEAQITPRLTARFYTELDSEHADQSAEVNIGPNGLAKNQLGGAGVPQVFGTIGANSSQVAYTDNYPGTHDDAFRSFLNLDYAFDTATISSRSYYGLDKTRLTQDTDFQAYPEPAATFAFENELQDFKQQIQQVSQEFRIASTNGGRFKWLAGVYGLYEQANLHDYSQYTLDHSSVIFPHGRLEGTNNPLLNPYTTTNRDTFHGSAYGQAGYTILPGLEATAEVRLATETESAYKPNQSRTAISLQNSNVTTGPGGNPAGITYGSDANVTKYVAPRFALSYQIDPDRMIYASIAKGVKPGGFSLINVTGGSLNGQRFKAETLWAYEAGFKTEWLDHRLMFNADAYFHDYHDRQISYDNFLTNPVTLGVTNAGTTYAIGQEVELAYRPVPALTIHAFYSHIDEYFSDYISPITADQQVLKGGNFAGKKVPNTPPHSAYLSVRYERPVWNLSGHHPVEGFMEGTLQYESARYGDDYNTWKLGAFIEPRVQVGLETPRWSALFFMNNMFNDRTIRSAITNVDLHNNQHSTALALLPDPRTFGVRLGYKF